MLPCLTLKMSREPAANNYKTMKNTDTIQTSTGQAGSLALAPGSAQFSEFPKIARLSRECIITEKIDGTNAQIYIAPLGAYETFPDHSLGVFDIGGVLHYMAAGSRPRWITPQDDNYGFAAWATRNFDQLKKLGAGRHFGEWWGAGIQRKYDMTEKRFSMFNVSRWCTHGSTPEAIPSADPRVVKMQDVLPPCVGLVPVLYRGMFTTHACDEALAQLRDLGSVASVGFRKPEGIVCFHVAANAGFKKTLERDEAPKSSYSLPNVQAQR